MMRLTPMFLIAGLTLAACNQATERRAEDAADRVGAAADRLGDRIENAADNALAAVKPTPTAQDFVKALSSSDAFEIAAAKIAAVQATSGEVKAFAAQMISAHEASSGKLKAAAAQARPSLKPDAALSADQQEDLDDLRKLTGAKFDEEYMEEQVDAHEDALALLRSYASGGTDAELKTLAGELIPVVEGHLKMAHDLHAKHHH